MYTLILLSIVLICITRYTDFPIFAYLVVLLYVPAIALMYVKRRILTSKFQFGPS